MTSPLSALEGKYEILEKLREGGMGAIYHVRHRLLEEDRVVKIMRSQLADDDSFAQRFIREAKAASRLRHPNIAQIYDFTIGSDGTAYIVLEYIDGIDLRQVVRRRPLPSIGGVLTISIQSLTALGVLHRKGFVHRDISPDNLMVTRGPSGELMVKLIDLGIAKALDKEQGLTSTGEFLGKIHYASPEHFGGPDGQDKVEPRSDLYSFGVVLYELLTGAKPYAGKDFTSITSAHLFHPPIGFAAIGAAERVPAALQEIALQALAKDRDDRLPSAAAFRQALETVLAEWKAAGGAIESAAEILQSTTALQRPEEDEPGSTQDRLDQDFPQSEGTPVPTPVGQDTERESTFVLETAATAPRAEPVPPPPAEAPAAPRASPPAAAPPALPRPSSHPAPPPAEGTARRGWTKTAAIAGAAAVLVTTALLLSLLARDPERPVMNESTPSATTAAVEPVASTDGVDRENERIPLEPAEIPERAPAADQERLFEMTESYAEISRLETTDQGTPADRIAAWRRFLELYAGDIPSTGSDERMRTQARLQLEHWEEVRARPSVAPATSEVEPMPEPDPVMPAETTMVAAAVEPVPEPIPSSASPSAQDEASTPAVPSDSRQALAERRVPVTPESLRDAAANGDRELVGLLLAAGVERGGRAGSRAIVNALEAHAFGVADDLRAAGAALRSPGSVLDNAAARGDLETVRYLVGHHLGDRQDALEEALDDEQLAVARYLVEEGGVPLRSASDEAEDFFVNAAEDGHREAVEWLISAGVNVHGGAGKEAISEADDHGHTEIVALIRAARDGT